MISEAVLAVPTVEKEGVSFRLILKSVEFLVLKHELGLSWSGKSDYSRGVESVSHVTSCARLDGVCGVAEPPPVVPAAKLKLN